MPSFRSSLHVGSGKFVYEVRESFGPSSCIATDCAGVAVDSKDRVYVLNRSREHAVIVLTPEGTLIDAWGAGFFKRAHAIFAGPDDSIYCVDDQGHAVRKFTPEGRLVLEISTAENPADTGYVPGDIGSVVRAGPPFNTPTGVALAPEGDVIVSDGYGNARIHRFTARGEFVSSFGEPGHGPGQFFLPHGVAVDKAGRIFVADRENSRVQVFTPEGTFVSEWRSPRASCLFIDSANNLFLTEMGEVMQGSPGKKRLVLENARPRVTVMNTSGEVLAELPPSDPDGAGLFFAPHSIAMDSSGNLYVTEVSDSYSGGLAPRDRPRVHKYVRQ